MERETRIAVAVVAGLAVVVALLTLGGRVQEELAPEPRAAWVAVAVAGEPVASTTPVELEAGQPFRLHAVLEAEDWRGERVYFTEAQALRIDGREVPAAALRRWSGSQEVRVLWFTVEGGPPYLEATAASDLDRLQFRELYRSDWPQAWTVPGSVEPSRRRFEAGPPPASLPAFGTQRFHVRLEFFGPASTIVPQRRVRSWGAEELRRESARFPTVTMRLAGPLAASSGVFGLPQVEPTGEATPALVSELRDLWQRRLCFSRLALLREVLGRAGQPWEALDWREVELEAGPAWGPAGAAAGDLLRVGERFVILVADHGQAGRLDYDDLGFDFDNGAALRRLGEIFIGEGLVEWAAIGSPAGS